MLLDLLLALLVQWVGIQQHVHPIATSLRIDTFCYRMATRVLALQTLIVWGISICPSHIQAFGLINLQLSLRGRFILAFAVLAQDFKHLTLQQCHALAKLHTEMKSISVATPIH